MEFACSHVVCNWRSESLSEDEAKVSNQGCASTLPCGLSRAQSVSDHPYDNRVTFVQKPAPSMAPPPVPPRNIQRRDTLFSALPPPLPPRGLENNGETHLKANVNVVSLKVGSLVDVSKASAIKCSQKPVCCGKCNAVMSSASSPVTHQKTIIWSCEFCGKENVYPQTTLKGGRFPLRNPPGRDILYMDDDEDTEYENLDDMLIVLCVDISGSMSVTSEISPGNSMRSPTYISRLLFSTPSLNVHIKYIFLSDLSRHNKCEVTPIFWVQGVQEALQMVLSSLQKTSSHRRVALVTFNNEYIFSSTFQINIVNIGTVATEIQSAVADNVLATSVMATLLAPDGMYFPYEEDNHRLVREIGNVTDGVEITFQFAVRPEKVESFQQRDRVPFQLQLSFKTRDLQKVTRVITQQKRVTISSWVWAGSLNMSILGVHCAQLCARLTMEGRVQEAQRQLRAQQDLLKDISQQKPSPKEESIYGNWISTMSMICEDLTTVNKNTTETDAKQASRTSSTASLSDAAAKVVYQMKRAKSVSGKGQRVAMMEN
ncbi:uncharacterized protein LOC107675486 [Sinocyclocheilus anshuiensis]|uniref:uncharacterized protein LOC107675486 n=1 Tax=Sinocyclocheilus anshuiensis TaxID=1608454 RepID=UPI0007BA1C26|nr:PREDICTED: uncharacterized protein LOC107675486 [Sinocyclocheilus anshuiensis]